MAPQGRGRLGAADSLVKPFETEQLPLELERARRSRQSARVEEHRRSDRAKEGFFFGHSTTLGGSWVPAGQDSVFNRSLPSKVWQTFALA